jgi:hypothetical protein
MNKKLELGLPGAETVAGLLSAAKPMPYVWKTLQKELGDYRREAERKRVVRHLSKETFDPDEGHEPEDPYAYYSHRPGSICATQEEDIEVMYFAEDKAEPWSIDITFMFKRKDGMFVYLHAEGCSCGKTKETLACSDDFGRFWNCCLSNSARRLLWTVLQGKGE